MENFKERIEKIFPFLLRHKIFSRNKIDKAIFEFEEGMLHVTAFVLLIFLAGIIASLGILRGNQAVVIGAMIITPLVDPFVGLALAIVMKFKRLFWRSLCQSVLGILLLFFVSALMAFIFPALKVHDLIIIQSLQIGLPEVVIAIASGFVAAFAMAFEKMSNKMAGAAITLALAPPLAIAGIDFAQGRSSVFYNAISLFVLNALGIILISLFVFWLFGFRREEEKI